MGVENNNLIIKIAKNLDLDPCRKKKISQAINFNNNKTKIITNYFLNNKN